MHTDDESPLADEFASLPSSSVYVVMVKLVAIQVNCIQMNAWLISCISGSSNWHRSLHKCESIRCAMEQYTPRVGDMADPFIQTQSSPASEPTPTSRHVEFYSADSVADEIATRMHHSADSSPLRQHGINSVSLATARQPSTGASAMLEAANEVRKERSAAAGTRGHRRARHTIGELSKDELIDIVQRANARLDEFNQQHVKDDASHTPAGSAERQRFSNTPSLSPGAGSNSPASVATPSPIRPDRVGQMITNANAQGFYPAHACLHIGKSV